MSIICTKETLSSRLANKYRNQLPPNCCCCKCFDLLTIAYKTTTCGCFYCDDCCKRLFPGFCSAVCDGESIDNQTQLLSLKNGTIQRDFDKEMEVLETKVQVQMENCVSVDTIKSLLALPDLNGDNNRHEQQEHQQCSSSMSLSASLANVSLSSSGYQSQSGSSTSSFLSNFDKCNGKYSWKIDNYSRRLQKSKSATLRKETFYIDSVPIYFKRDEPGYLFRFRLYLNGLGLGAENEYMSVFYQILPGEYDDLLKWPFTKPVKIGLLLPTESAMAINSPLVVEFPNFAQRTNELKEPNFIVNNATRGKHQFEKIAIVQKNYVMDDCLVLLIEIL